MIMWPPRASHTHARVRTTPRLAHSLSSSLALCASVPLCFSVPLSVCHAESPTYRRASMPPCSIHVLETCTGSRENALTSQIPLLLQLPDNGGVVGQLKQRPSSTLPSQGAAWQSQISFLRIPSSFT